MARGIVFLLFVCFNAGFVHGMQCSLDRSSNFLEKYIDSCPQLFQPAEKSYCCYDIANERVYCCDVTEFALKTGFGIIVPLVVAAGLMISLIVCCVSCLCCRCCPWYRRRHQGTVYGKVLAPSVVHVIQTPATASQPVQTSYVPPYPGNVAGVQQPPPGANEFFAKQPPYNPSYVQ